MHVLVVQYGLHERKELKKITVFSSLYMHVLLGQYDYGLHESDEILIIFSKMFCVIVT
jgi:hypothetical protein